MRRLSATRGRLSGLGAFALLVFASTLSAGEEQFDVDVGKSLTLAVSAVSERFPDVAADDLALDGGITLGCLPFQPVAGRHALDVEFRPCFAQLDFILLSSPTRLYYMDHDRSCKLADQPEGIGVGLWPGSNLNAGLKRKGGEVRVVDCTEVFGETVPNPDNNLAENAFAVDVNEALQIAFNAAIEKYPDISADDLEFEGVINMWCEPDSYGKAQQVGDLKFAPCLADVRFRSPSSIIEYRYVDVDGTCNISRGPESIKVRIGGGEIDPECARGSYSPTEELVVECTEEFDNADRWTE